MVKIVRFSILLLLILAGTLPVQGVTAQGRQLVVAYIDGDTLYGWREGDSTSPHTLARGMDDFSRVKLSPDGSQVAFDRAGTLWTVAVDGSSEARPMATLDSLNPDKTRARFVLDFAWSNKTTILFNTYTIGQSGANRQELEDDLWRVDAVTGETDRLLQNGQGGAFSISPDGNHIAIVQPGDYAGQKPGTISVIDADGTHRFHLLDFPVVNTAASSSFYPAIQWSADGQALFVAIPDPNLVYATQNQPKTALYRWRVGSVQIEEVGGAVADFFALPEFAENGASVVYSRRVGNVQDNQLAVFVSNADGTGEREIARGKIGALEPAHWTPSGDALTFVQGKAGEMWMARRESDYNAVRYPDAQDPVFDPVWADAQTLVYATTLGGAGELHYVTADPTSAPISIVKRKTGGSFDARRQALAARRSFTEAKKMSHNKSIGEQNYEKFAERYAAAIETKAHNAYYDRPATLSLLPDVSGLRVLDAGCGPGIYAEWLVQHGASVVAFDVTPQMVELTRKRVGDQAEVLRADLTEPLAFAAEASFDLVICPLVLDNIERWDSIFVEFCRVLKAGGMLVFSCGHPFGDYLYVIRKQLTEGNYFNIEFFENSWGGFGEPEPMMKSYRRPLGDIVNPLLKAGFMLDTMLEPLPTEDFKRAEPEDYARLLKQPGFLCVRARKP